MSGYWPSRWPCEDGGPDRPQSPRSGGGLDIGPDDELHVTSRLAPAATMAVLRDPGEVYLLRHSAGEGATSLVERIDPETLEPIVTSVDLAAGPVWPGGLGAHANGSLYVVFGNHAHRLDADLRLLASRQLPRSLPYNSFVVLPDGCLVTKDFPASRREVEVPPDQRQPSELLVLEPDRLEIVATLALPEPSIARLSADGQQVYVVGDTSLMRVGWDGSRLSLDDSMRARYRTVEGQRYGWDCTIAAGSAWFLDDGDGAERYSGTLRGHGTATAPLQLVRVDLADGSITTGEVCGRPGGLIANPPVVDAGRGIAVGYDSGNGVVTAFDIGEDGKLSRRWTRDQDHAAHPLLFADTGELVTGDHDPDTGEDLVVLDVETGEERARVATGSPVQSVLFPAAGFDRDLYYCSFTTVARVAVGPRTG